MKRSEILENRKKVVAYLQKPHLKKAKGSLRDNKGGRCCLGHMCDALEIKYVKEGGEYLYGADREEENAPEELMLALGLHTSLGGFDASLGWHDGNKGRTIVRSREFTVDKVPSVNLAELNDRRKISTKRIGEYLECVINGGKMTPFKHLTCYEE